MVQGTYARHWHLGTISLFSRNGPTDMRYIGPLVHR